MNQHHKPKRAKRDTTITPESTAANSVAPSLTSPPRSRTTLLDAISAERLKLNSVYNTLRSLREQLLYADDHDACHHSDVAAVGAQLLSSSIGRLDAAVAKRLNEIIAESLPAEASVAQKMLDELSRKRPLTEKGSPTPSSLLDAIAIERVEQMVVHSLIHLLSVVLVASDDHDAIEHSDTAKVCAQMLNDSVARLDYTVIKRLNEVVSASNPDCPPAPRHSALGASDADDGSREDEPS